MTSIKRITSVINGLFIILFSLFLMRYGKKTFPFILSFLGLSLFITGIRYLIYHFRMSRKMVGGKMILFVGLIYFDLGLVTLGLHDSPMIIVVIYLLCFHAFTGAISILRAYEVREYNGTSWKLKMINGIVNIIIAITAFVIGGYLNSPEYLVQIYSLGLLYAGVMLIVSAFRRTAIVYIP